MPERVALSLITLLLASQLIGCATVAPTLEGGGEEATPPRLVEISVLGQSRTAVPLPEKSRIVIAGIAGGCNLELKNALARRLVDNDRFQVLTRDNLDQLLVESDRTWGGRFNSQTAVQLGELLGASIFIVGQVIYCGTPDGRQFYRYGYSDEWADSSEDAEIFAILQVIDPSTGKVLLSSANEGQYSPTTEPLYFQSVESEGGGDGPYSARNPNRLRSALDAFGNIPLIGGVGQVVRQLIYPGEVPESRQQISLFGSPSVGSRPELPEEKKEDDEDSKTINYGAYKAAEDLANGFADKVFSRPHWEKVEMWESPRWDYGKSLTFVKLGRCLEALSLFEGEKVQRDLAVMPPANVAEHLHNYGVSLLCANKPEEAMDKLRSAYRIGNDQATLRMLGFAAKLIEHSITIEIDQQPEVDTLFDRREVLLSNVLPTSDPSPDALGEE